MVLHHVDKNTQKSPPLPFDLLAKVHISIAEGKAMGINSNNIMKYRDDFGILNSDAFDTTSPSKQWNIRQFGRKRMGSEVLKSSESSSKRDSSPTKVQCICN